MICDDVAALRLRLTAPRDDALRRLAEADNVDPGLVRADRHERLSGVPDNEAEAMSGPQPLPASTRRGEVKNPATYPRQPAGGCVHSEMKKRRPPSLNR